MIKDIFIGTIIFISLIGVIMGALSIGEKNECRSWEQNKKEFAQWQIDQCAHYNITIK